MILLCTIVLSWINICDLVVLEFTILLFSSSKFTVGILFTIKKGNNHREIGIFTEHQFSIVIDQKAITLETTFSTNI